MNDITALAQRMKAAAEKATPGEWCAFTDSATKTYAVHTPKDKRCEDVIKWTGFDGQKNAGGNAEFIAAANPVNVLALVEALEKAQQPAEPFGFTDGDAHGMVYEPRHADRLANPCPVYRLPPLESKSRTVTVKLPAEYLNADGSVNADMANTCPVVSAYREAHRAAGIQVIEGEQKNG